MKKTFYIFLLLLIFAAGCSSSKVGLSGKVTFTDGTPLSIGEIYFETDTFLARATIKPDGTFTVGSLKESDGLPTGTYRVSIVGAFRKLDGMDETGMPLQELLIDEKYTSGTTSNLTCTVPAENGKFNITVERFKKKEQ
ncbi:MAG: hypothetical protein LBQ66_10565 [Planctomycetaceae bacterium]|jgi:hypothetical protein|nr:hypothetical protein [Planctomycetaceae bacterium]